MAEALVVTPRDEGELAELLRGKNAIRDGDPQHVGMELQIEAVLQAQRPELVLGQLAGETTRHLTAELFHALGNESGVKFVVAIHRPSNLRSGRSRNRHR